jgi:photosystem II stability/assembly factor-like uncharacterized protein
MKIYSYILLFSVVVLFNRNNIQAQWTSESCPTKENLNSIALAGQDSYWAVGNNGTILYKRESSWSIYPRPTSEHLYSVDFVSMKNGWAVGAKGTILHFDGIKWESVVSPTRNDLLSVSFKDKDNGIAVGRSGIILIFDNGTWSIVRIKLKGDLTSTIYENNNIWLGGGLECVSHPIIKIKDIQNNDITYINEADIYASIHSMFFLNSVNGWAVGSPSTILHYDGINWTKHALTESFSSLNDVYFADENNGISVGYGGTILCYTSENWNKEISGVIRNLNGALINGSFFYAVGDSGTIVSKMTNQNNTVSQTTDNSSAPQDLIPEAANDLSSIYNNKLIKTELLPNPCDKFLTIKLIAEKKLSAGMIIVTDMEGKVILIRKVSFNDTKFTYLLETDCLEDGLYFLKMVNEDTSNTSMFVVIHK